jgi:hypothetical protein
MRWIQPPAELARIESFNGAVHAVVRLNAAAAVDLAA